MSVGESKRTHEPAVPGSRRDVFERRVKDAAARGFMENGIDGTTLGDIASAAGTARTALYHYFDNKEQLVLELVRESAADAREIVASAAARHGEGLSPSQQLWDAVRRLAELSLERPERVRFLYV